MVSQEVIAYVQRLRAQGYAPQAIRQNLLASGYSIQDTDAALTAVARPMGAAPPRNWKPIAAGIGAGILVLILVIIVLVPSGPAIALITSPAAVEVRAGSSLTFSDRFTFERDIDADEIELDHELIAPATGNLISSLDETVDVAPTATSRFAIPEDLQPGRYVIRTRATADGHEAESSFSFRVLPALQQAVPAPAPGTIDLTPSPGQPPEPTPTQECNDFDICTDDRSESGTCVFDPLPVCCGDYVCEADKGETTATCGRDCAAQPTAKSSADIIAEAQETAVADVGKAELLCGTLVLQSDGDQCFDSVARIASRSSTCGKIGNVPTKDSCLLYFAINKDEFAVCATIEDPNLQQSCYSFKNLHELQAAAQQPPQA